MNARSLILLLVAASAGVAQQPGTLVVAHVMDVRDGSLIPAADVTILGGEFRGRTDSLGRVAIAAVPAGEYSVEARRLGYKPAVTHVIVSGADSLEVVLALSPISQALPGMKVTETAATIHLREFEERLRNHIGGFFITDSVIRRAEADGIEVLLKGRVPGIRPATGPGGKVFVFSTRGQTSLQFRKGGETPPCQVEVFLDGVRLLDGDAALVPLMDLAGIEYYPPGYAPPQYRIPATGWFWQGRLGLRRPAAVDPPLSLASSHMVRPLSRGHWRARSETILPTAD